jgi:hypothetical protein
MRIVYFFFALLSFASSNAQNLSGFWVGTAMQNGRPSAFTYQLDLVQEGTTLSGKSISFTADGSASAEFSIIGTWEAGKIILQEAIQISPKGGGWCLKYARLRLGTTGDGTWVLQGDWVADNCTPGTIRLQKESGDNQLEKPEDEVFTPLGTWAGHLSQTDRSYGFYYEFTLDSGGTGKSKIVAEGNGGTATFSIVWRHDPVTDSLFVEEKTILEESEPEWKWCIKNLKMKLDHDPLHNGLEGAWSGNIEGRTGRFAGCAPGNVLLEKPVLNNLLRANIRSQQQQTASSNNNNRKLQLQRTIQVSSPNITLSVWDNGTEDGDVVTFFLNGHQIAKQLRISKNKNRYQVKLNAEENFLILYAEDLGEIKPNTVAVSIDDGMREQTVVLSSNLEQNGAVLIRQIKL